MFLKILILSVIFLSAALMSLGIKVLLKPNGRFPETHVSRNKALQRKGIGCARGTDIGCNSSGGFSGCSSCNPV